MQKKPKTHLHDGWGTLCNAQPVPAGRIVSHFLVLRADGSASFIVSARRRCVACGRIASEQGRSVVLAHAPQREMRRLKKRQRIS